MPVRSDSDALMSEAMLTAAAFERGRAISRPVSIRLAPAGEYELTVSRSGCKSVTLSLGGVALSHVTGWDLFPGASLVTKLLTWCVMVPWHRIMRPRAIVLRPTDGASSAGPAVVGISLGSTDGNAVLSLEPAEEVEVRILRKA